VLKFCGAACEDLRILPRPIEYFETKEFVGNGQTTYTAAGLRYVVEVSSDLTTWQSGPTVLQWSNRREALPGGMERVGIHITSPTLSTAPQIFIRLRVFPQE
jgi:hypothetical protein